MSTDRPHNNVMGCIISYRSLAITHYTMAIMMVCKYPALNYNIIANVTGKVNSFQQFSARYVVWGIHINMSKCQCLHEYIATSLKSVIYTIFYCLFIFPQLSSRAPIHVNEGLLMPAIKAQLISCQLVDSKAKWRGARLYCIWSGVYHLYNCMVTSSTSQLYCR